jgi:thymidylate synthase (FAD)
MKTRLISISSPTQEFMSELPAELHTPEGIIAYCARVSSDNQINPDYAKLLSYCITHKHWSIFETVNMTVEVETSRAVSAQILRHKSFFFQEFSQRYQHVSDFELYEARRQDLKNRQNSIDDIPEETKEWFRSAQNSVWLHSKALYNDALKKGIAKEQARFLLPLSTKTKLYVTGNVRSWIHYLQVRTDLSTQKEHRDIALEIKEIFKGQFPITSKALGWS